MAGSIRELLDSLMSSPSPDSSHITRLIDTSAQTAEKAQELANAITERLEKTVAVDLLTVIERATERCCPALMVAFQSRAFLQAFHHCLRAPSTPPVLKKRMLRIVVWWEAASQADPAMLSAFRWYAKSLRAAGVQLEAETNAPSASQAKGSYSERQAKLYRELRVAEQYTRYFEEISKSPALNEEELERMTPLLEMFVERLTPLPEQLTKPAETAIKNFAQTLYKRAENALNGRTSHGKKAPSIIFPPENGDPSQDLSFENLDSGARRSATRQKPENLSVGGSIDMDLLDAKYSAASVRRTVSLPEINVHAKKDLFDYF